MAADHITVDSHIKRPPPSGETETLTVVSTFHASEPLGFQRNTRLLDHLRPQLQFTA
jgi:hypothetical protein